jgi:hypothetical protein
MGRDVHADAIVKKAKDTRISLDDRAVEAVNSIVREYYDESLLSKVVYRERETGLSTSPVGRGKDLKGKIFVGKYFIEHIDAFAHRVLQVGHELQHIQQERDGMVGEKNKDKREFLAFYWEALEPTKEGTGHLPAANRLKIIDMALGYFNCFTKHEQKTLADKQAELLTHRKDVDGKNGNSKVDPPTACVRE